MAVWDTAATADLGSSLRLERHNGISQRRGYREAPTYPAPARFRFGDGQLGVVQRAAGIPVGIAGGKGELTACVLDAETPALFRKGASEPLGR